jgi:hypothetical protein
MLAAFLEGVMGNRVSVIVVLVVGSILACGSDPAPAPAAPSANAGASGAQGTIAPLGGTTQPAPLDGTTQPAPLVAGTSKTDIVACLGHIDPKVTDACRSCVATSCREQIKTVGAACPDFSTCVCDGNPMTECGPKLLTAGCGQAGMAVGTCVHQSCAAQCPSPVATASTTAATTPSTVPAATSGDSCADLTACCAQFPGGAPPSCAKLVVTKNTQACTSLLTVFRNMNKCH